MFPRTLFRAHCLLLLLILIGLPFAWAQEGESPQILRFGVFAYLGLEDTSAQYQPIVDYLNSVLTQEEIVLEVMEMDTMFQRIEEGTLELASTNPSHFLVTRSRYPLTGVIATLVQNANGIGVDRLAGAIVTREDCLDIQQLRDLRGQTIAIPSFNHMGGYRAQAYELHQVSIHLPQDARVQVVGSHYEAIRQLLRREVDVAFVRDQVLEIMESRGELEWEQIRIINEQSHPRFPYRVSTRLHPEWPVFALPHTDPAAVRRVASALFSLEPDHPAALSSGIYGYTIPADYLEGEQLSRALRLPPFDQAPQFTLLDIWRSYHWFILAVLLTMGLIVLLLGLIFKRNRTLSYQERELKTTVEHLEMATAQARDLALEAEMANHAKSEFLANMSHEIRTPLNGVIGMNNLLLETELDAQQRRYAEAARISGESLLNLINDILDFSKIEAGHLELEELEFSLRDLMDAFCQSLAPQAERKNLRLSHWVDPLLPDLYRGDPARIRQILYNLTGNALKFTHQGSVSLRVERGPAPAPSADQSLQNLMVRVKDTGIGIPPEKQDRLFRKFSQVDSSTTRHFGGTGLGLAISRQLVELMSGTIGVESQEGQGSEFWFTISVPSVQEQQDPATPDFAPLPGEVPGSQTCSPIQPVEKSLSRGRILLVEDNAINQLLARAMLEKLQLEVKSAESGEEALNMLEAETFDLIFMDIQMPGMDGYECTRRIRNSDGSWAETPIVAMTANALKGDRDKSLSQGMDDYLSKPLDKLHLRRVLDRWFDLT